MNSCVNNMDWLSQEPIIEETQIVETIETELLIAGGGTGGLTAAASAAELGLRVLLIEIKKAFTPLRKEIGAVGSRIQKSEGVDIDIQELVRQHVMYSSAYIDQKLPLIWACESGEMMDWYETLITARGARMTLQGGYDAEVKAGSYTRFPTGHRVIWPEGITGAKTMSEYASRLGTKFRMETGLVKLLKEDGRVTGAIAKETKTGKYIRISASKAVMIATGGYAKNTEMLKTLQPETIALTGLNVSDSAAMGDGIKASLWAGAIMDDRHISILFDRCAIMPDETPETLKRSGQPTELISQPFLKVDLKGGRFSNESVPYDFTVHRAYSLPGKCFCVIFDSGFREETERFDMAGCSRMHPFGNGAPCGHPIEENIERLERMIEEGRFIKAHTLAELAEGLGLPVDRFERTVTRYNELFDKQCDEDFGKEPHRLSEIRKPPYYGVRACAFLLATVDGIRIDQNMNAMDKNGDPIPGLYIVGNDSGGYYANTYVNLVTGSCAGRNMTFARRAARVIAGKKE
ncbi:MAG: FAD-binding protein [Deltaproteobacteria bacterium]|nr:FAD-binding protein [Deltaproteobacteria bacterium]